jgi:hypothetical protein
MQVCGNAQTVQCFRYDKGKNTEVDTLDSIRGLSVQPGALHVPATYDPGTKIVSLLVNVAQLFAQNRGLALTRGAAAVITREQSTVPGFEGLFEHARRLYTCESIVFVCVYTECKNQFLATVPLHLAPDGVVRALLPWNGYCYEEGVSALTTQQVCVCCIEAHVHYLQASTCSAAPIGDVDTKTYDGAMRACLSMLSVFGTIDRRQMLMNSCKQVLAVFDSPERSKCTDDTAHADVLTYSSIALLGLLPVGIVHRAMTQPAMQPRLVQVLLRDVCALFAGRCVLTGNDAEIFTCLLVWNLHRLQADVETYRREQGEDQRRMLALRSRERMYMVGDCEDLAAFLLQLVGTIFRVPQLRRQVPPHVRIGAHEQNMLLPARGFFRTEVHAFPVQLELRATSCMMRVIEATRPVFCFETTDDRNRAQQALRALPGGDCMQFTLAAQQRDCYTVWFLGECMVFVLSHGGKRRAVLEHMAKPRTAYAGPLRLTGPKDAARIHALARADSCARSRTLVLMPEHVFFYVYADLAQYAPQPAQARLDPEVTALVLPIARHIELQQSFGDLLCALFCESPDAHELLAENLERKLGACPAPLQPLLCALRVPGPGCPPAGLASGPCAPTVPVRALQGPLCTTTGHAPMLCPPPGPRDPLCMDPAEAPGVTGGPPPQGPLCTTTGQAPMLCPPAGLCALETGMGRIPPLAQPVRDALLKLHARLWSVQSSLCYYMYYARDTERPAELCPCVVAHARDITAHCPLFVGWYGKFLCPFFEFFARICCEQAAGADEHACGCMRLDFFCMQVVSFLQCVQGLLARAQART